MVVEFQTVHSWWPEQHQKDLDRELQGKANVDLFSKEDVIYSIAIEMDDIIEFEQGVVFHNDVPKDCVYVTSSDREYTSRNLLIHYDDFKLIFNKLKNTTVMDYKELLNEVL